MNRVLITVLFIINFNFAFSQNEKFIKLVTKFGKIEMENTKTGEHLYQTTIGFFDINNQYHELPSSFITFKNMRQPALMFDGAKYYIYVYHFTDNFEGSVYTFNGRTFSKDFLFNGADIGKITFFSITENYSPILYTVNDERQIIAFTKEKNAWEKDISDFTIRDLSSKGNIESVLVPSIFNAQFPYSDQFYSTEESGAKALSPYRTVWCEGDDLTHANPKPFMLYKEVPGSRIEIANMPKVQMQSEFGECRAFSLAVLLQKHTCDEWKEDVPDCKNPPADLDISYFGLMRYTHNSLEDINTFQPNQKKARSAYDYITRISNSPEFIVASCKPFYKMADAFSKNGQAGIDKYNEFIEYLKNLYYTQKVEKIDDNKDYTPYLNTLFKYTGMEPQYFNLKMALTKKNFDYFMYTLFFEDCPLEVFASGFRPIAYPDDSVIATNEDIKNRIIRGLQLGKPVLTSQVCMFVDKDNRCESGHSSVVSGYRKVYDKYGNYKELFKVHNSWGNEWQQKHNDGWVDADILINSFARLPLQDKTSRMNSAVVIWLDYGYR